MEAVLAAALITTHATAHGSSNSATPTARAEKVKRPSISSAGTTEDWQYFKSRWSDYVKATKLDGTDKIIQLLECCDEQLRKDLTRNAGGTLTEKTEDEVFVAMRSLAVREENTMVARVTLHNMKQDRDEPIRAYGARLRGQASVCKFTQQCTGCDASVDYTETMLRDVLCRGLEDSEIQMDLLGDKNQDMTLEEVLKFVEAKEAGKRSASRLLLPHAVDAAAGSSYRHQKKAAARGTPPKDQEPCTYCGSKGHGRSAPTRVRRKECPAFGVVCNHCNRNNHFEKMCRSRDNPKRTKDGKEGEHENAVFDTLCGITSCNSRGCITLDHHIFDQSTSKWRKTQSKSQPFLTLSASVQRADYEHFGFRLCSPPTQVFISAMADTGCQSCLAGFKVVKKLGLSTKDLIPVSLKMHAADNHDIQILGATILRLSGKDRLGKERSTRQVVYVTNGTDKLFLSREACMDLGIISHQFPLVGEASMGEAKGCQPSPPQPIAAAATEAPNDHPARECNCPRRTKPPPIPSTLPYPATEENREKLKQHLLDHYSSSTFNTCEHQPLPMMTGPSMRLMINPKATPTAHHSPIPVPLHWQDEVKAGLDRDVRLGVIEPVPIGEPVTWCHRMVICAKKNGKPRRTIDFQALNTHATRETHHTQSPFHQARSVPHNQKKTVFDAWNGYHSVPLHPDDRHLTTFITPWGRYRYCAAPQGYIASGDGYSRRYDAIVSTVPNKTKCIDDTLLWSNSIEESYFQAAKWLDTCGTNGITLNPEKFQFALDEVEFAGFEITCNTVRPCKKYLRAISDFPTPRSITDVRSWFGLVNQVSYAFSMADQMLPFRDLLKPNKEFNWNEDLQTTFDQSKIAITQEIANGVRIFDKSKPTCLATDWSKHGIGYWLFQKHCSCPSNYLFCCNQGWKITLVGSRFTHPAESRYAPIEGEALAVADTLDKARHFVLGCRNLTIAVDHKPLLKIFGDRSLEHISNTRLLRNLKERTLRYRFQMTHIPGIKNRAPDTLSRHPTGDTHPPKLALPDDVYHVADTPTQPPIRIPSQLIAGVCIEDKTQHTDLEDSLQASAISSLQSIRTINWDQVQTATSSDNTMNSLLSIIEDGLPEKKHLLPASLKEYHQFREHLYCIDGVVIYKDRIVIPPSLRQDCLTALHAAHQGTSSMISRAETSIFWPGITKDIHEKRANCEHCNRIAPSQAAMPPTPPIISAYPFQCVCADYFHYQGFNYLVIVDRYSNWPIVERAQDGAQGLIKTLRQTFATYGIPDELSSDGGPVFVAHSTRKFLSDWGIHHRLSSVAFPHSNCRAEIGVKTIKRLITNNVGKNGDINVDTFQRAILQYRNTPAHDTKLSPAMCIFGRPTRDLIPILPGKYHPHQTWRESLIAREEALRNRHMIHHEKWKEHTKALPPLRVGDHVRIQNQTGPHPTKWDKTGIVIEVLQNHQYRTKVDGSGRITCRNRKFLRQYKPAHQPGPRRSILEDLALPPTSPLESIPSQTQSPRSTPVVDTPTSHSSPQSGTAIPTLPTPPPAPTLSPPTPTPTPTPTLPPEPMPLPPQPRASTRPRQPPAWQRSGDYVLL